MTDIKYDQPIEVSEARYRAIMNLLGDKVAGREDSGKFYIKVWMMKYAYIVQRMIDTKL